VNVTGIEHLSVEISMNELSKSHINNVTDLAILGPVSVDNQLDRA
jgi:hypothetical protein